MQPSFTTELELPAKPCKMDIAQILEYSHSHHKENA